jgi:L-2-hydroxyglutarate oxidase
MAHDITLIGGGIVGLATAYQILQRNPNLRLQIIEKENTVAAHQTGNNSGVIHSGIYYKPNSLKAKNCIEGYHLLLDFCQKEDIFYDLCGKVIVATRESELPALQNIYERGKANGLDGLKLLSDQEIKDYEPHVVGIKGIFVPQTGIVDYRLVAEKLWVCVQKMGAEVRLGEKLLAIKQEGSLLHLETSKDSYQSRFLINCAGLYSDKVALMTEKNLPLRIVPFRGEYYKLKPEKEYLVKSLIYPVPDPAFPFLGVHFTRMARGGVEAGPNAVLAYRREGYRKSDIQWGELYETLTWKGFQKVAFKYWKTGLGELYRSYSKAAFTRALQKLIPEITEQDLMEGGAGVRAQACDREGGLLDDFMIVEKNNILHVCNAPSPAATSSLAIGKTLAEMILKKI